MKDKKYKPCSCCGSLDWDHTGSYAYWSKCDVCGLEIKTDEINNRPIEDELRCEIEKLLVTIEKLKAENKRLEDGSRQLIDSISSLHKVLS